MDVGLEWNQRYAKPGYTYGTAPNEFLVSVADRIPQGRVLSLGDGEGRNSVYLARLGYDVTAVDVSDVGLEKDGILSIFCHLPKPLRQQVHAAAVSGLKPED